MNLPYGQPQAPGVIAAAAPSARTLSWNEPSPYMQSNAQIYPPGTPGGTVAFTQGYSGLTGMGYGAFWDFLRVPAHRTTTIRPRTAGVMDITGFAAEGQPTGFVWGAGAAPTTVEIGAGSGDSRSRMTADQAAGLIGAIGTAAAGIGALIHGGRGGGYVSDTGAAAAQAQAQAAAAAAAASQRNMMFLGIAGLGGLALVGLALSQQK